MIAVLLCALLALFPQEALKGAGLGLEICLKAVIPSLLPFMLISNMAVSGGWGQRLGKALSLILRPLFGMGPAASMCFVTGLLGGYPCGAAAAAQCVENGLMTKEQGQRALAFCNNSGPLFIIGTAGAAVYHSTRAGTLLYFCHVLGAMAAALVFGRGTASGSVKLRTKKASFGALAGSAAKNSGAAILGVCSMVITFSAVIEAAGLWRIPLLLGVLEVSRGVKELGPYGISALPLAAAYISWGGLSVHFQTDAVAPELSKKYYYIGKLISCAVSGSAMWLCIRILGAGIII